MLKGLSSLLIRGRPLAKKTKRVNKKKDKVVRKLRAMEESRDNSTSKESASTGETPKPTTKFENSGNPSRPSTTAAKPMTAKSVPKKLFNAMKFDGPGPEVINSRCAMVGFPTTVLYEHSEHRPFLELLSAHKTLFAVACVVITVASLVPIAKEVKFGGIGFFKPNNEMFLGRSAMIGVLAVIIFELKIGTNFF